MNGDCCEDEGEYGEEGGRGKGKGGRGLKGRRRTIRGYVKMLASGASVIRTENNREIVSGIFSHSPPSPPPCSPIPLTRILFVSLD